MMRKLVSLIVLVLAANVGWAARADAVPRDGYADVSIRTLPAYPDYPITFEGRTYVTDSNGVVDLGAIRPSGIGSKLTLQPKEYTINGVRQRVEPARFYENGSQHTVIFNVFYLVDFGFKNDLNRPLDASVIHTIKVKNSIGEVAEIPAHEQSWLMGSRVVPLSGGLEVKKIYWTIQDVQYAGTNVVNASQQRFQPADVQHVNVSLLFYTAQLHVHDALFGFRRSAAINLIYPDGSVKPARLDDDGSLFLPSLPRGNYSVVISGFGPKMTQSVAISTNQDLDLKYYSWFDIGAVILVGLGSSVGLLLLGLRRRRKLANGPDKPAGEAAPEAAPPAPNGEPESAPNAEAESEPKSRVRADAEPEAESAVKAEAEPEPKSAVTADAKPEPRSGVKPQADRGRKSRVKRQADRAAEPEAEAKPEPEPVTR